MNLELSDEQLALGDSVRRFLAERAPIAGYVRALLDDPTGMTEEVWLGLSQLGTTGLLVAEEHGGAGASMAEAGVVAEELGRALHPGPWLSAAVASVRALSRMEGTDAVSKLLRGIADGSLVTSLCLSAPDVAASPESMGAEQLVIEGEAREVPDAAAAQVLLVPVPVRDATTIFAVETSSPGVRVEALDRFDQTRKRFRVSFEGAPTQRLGALSAEQFEAVLDDVLIASAADALGAAQAVFDDVVAYAKLRVQFGQAIGSFQAVQHLCVDMFETVELARSGVIEALWAADAARSEERHLAALRIKAFAGRLAEVGETAIQVLGGIGFTWEHDAHLYLRRLMSWSELFGSPDRFLEEVGLNLVLSMQQKRSDS